MNVGHVNLHDGQPDRRDRIANRVCVVRVRTGVDRDRIDRFASGVKFVHDRTFGVMLHAANRAAERPRLVLQARVDIGERQRTVDFGFARPEQIEIRAVDDEHVHARRVRAGNDLALENCRTMPDRILTATALDGSFSIVAGITTDLVRETQQRHDLAPTASAAVGRLLSGAALLAASLKGREKLTLQIASEGPMRGIVADAQLNSPTEIGARGYTKRPDVDLPLNARGKFDVGGAVGRGYLQITRSYEVGQPYSGIVELQSGEIGDDLAAYLMTSEQIPSVVALGVLANPSGIKASGGIIAQVLPGSDERVIAELERSAAAMPPVTTMVDGGASVEDLIATIAGSLEVRQTRAYDVAYTCTCSLDRVERALLGLGRDELQKILTEQPQTEAVCEFCKTAYVLDRDDVHALIDRLKAQSI